jgi:hypothetical protein
MGSTLIFLFGDGGVYSPKEKPLVVNFEALPSGKLIAEHITS